MSATPFPNQPSPFADVNLFDLDVALREAVVHGRAMWACEALSSWGATLGAAQTYPLGAAQTYPLADAATPTRPNCARTTVPARASTTSRSIRRGTH